VAVIDHFHCGVVINAQSLVFSQNAYQRIVVDSDLVVFLKDQPIVEVDFMLVFLSILNVFAYIVVS